MKDRQKSTEALMCGHCGVKSRMDVVGSVLDTEHITQDDLTQYEAGTAFEVQQCPACSKYLLVSGSWHDAMDGPDDWSPQVLLPESDDRSARALLLAHRVDRQCMRRAVDEARRCVDAGSPPPPKVGAVVARPDGSIVAAFRGELAANDHAEFTLLEGKCGTDVLAGTTVYTTLEPCTTRSQPKIPCVDRLVARKVNRVVVGMLDPDDRIRGRGVLALRKANIRVDLFPPDLMTELEEMNREFIASRERAAQAGEPPPEAPARSGPHEPH